MMTRCWRSLGGRSSPRRPRRGETLALAPAGALLAYDRRSVSARYINKKALRAADGEQLQRVLTGEGVDRHLLGLMIAAYTAGEELPGEDRTVLFASGLAVLRGASARVDALKDVR